MWQSYGYRSCKFNFRGLNPELLFKNNKAVDSHDHVPYTWRDTQANYGVFSISSRERCDRDVSKVYWVSNSFLRFADIYTDLSSIYSNYIWCIFISRTIYENLLHGNRCGLIYETSIDTYTHISNFRLMFIVTLHEYKALLYIQW